MGTRGAVAQHKKKWRKPHFFPPPFNGGQFAFLSFIKAANTTTEESLIDRAMSVSYKAIALL